MIPVFLRLENFMSHARSVVDFSQFDAALIVGSHDGDTDVSNGVGKTAIFSAIVWCLYNKCRFRKKEKVVKRGRNGCAVEFVFNLDGTQYKVVRKLGKRSGSSEVTFHESGSGGWKDITCDTPTLTSRKIMETVGVNYDTFVNSVYFRQNDLSLFATATASERKEVLKDLLQIGIWDRLKDNAKAKAKVFSDKKDTADERIRALGDVASEEDVNRKAMAALNLRINDAERELAGAEGILDAARDELSKVRAAELRSGADEIRNIRRRLSQISSRGREIVGRRDVIKGEFEANELVVKEATAQAVVAEKEAERHAREVLRVESHSERKYAEQVVNDQDSIDECLDAYYGVDSEVANKREALETAERARMSYSQRISQLEALEPGKKCPTCFQQVGNLEDVLRDRRSLIAKSRAGFDDCTKAIAEIRGWLAEAEAVRKRADDSAIAMKRSELRCKECAQQRLAANKANVRLRDELGLLAREWGDLKSEKDWLVKKLELLGDSVDCQDALSKAEKAAELAASRVEELRKLRMDLGVEYGSLQGRAEVIQRKLSERTALLSRKKAMADSQDVHKRLVKAFGKNGVQAIIMENVTEDLRNYANGVLCQICNDQMSVDFLTQRQTASGSWSETFDIRVCMSDGVVDFEDLSGGEQVRVSIAIRLALSRILMRRVGSQLRVLLLDEVDQALDRKGLQALADAIHILSSEFKILVITHNENMKDRFDHVLTVQKGAGGSTVTQ